MKTLSTQRSFSTNFSVRDNLRAVATVTPKSFVVLESKSNIAGKTAGLQNDANVDTTAGTKLCFVLIGISVLSLDILVVLSN